MYQRLELLKKDLIPLADLAKLVEQLERDREQLRQQVESLQVEVERLRSQNSQLLHAWADQQFPEEMLDQASQEPGGSSLADIWRRLGTS